MSKIDELLSQGQNVLSANRVYSEPYEKNGVALITAASIRGGLGGGEGDSGEGEPVGSGGGFGMTARPVGAYLIKGDEVSWISAADTTRVILFSQVVLVVSLLVLRSIVRTRRKRA